MLTQWLVSKQQETPVKETDQAGSHVRKDSLLTLGLGGSVAAVGAFGVERLCDSLDHRGGLHVGTAGECHTGPA